LAPVLETLLPDALPERDPAHPAALFAAAPGGLALSPRGKSVLMDFLTADAAVAEPRLSAADPGLTPRRLLDRLRFEGLLRNLAGGAAAFAADDSEPAPAQLVYDLPGLSEGAKAAEGAELYRDPATGNLRLIVEAKGAAATDRYKVLDAGEAAEVYRETGVDGSVIAGHGGRLVRAVDNLLEVDVPESQAGALASALDALGVDSMPSRLVRWTGAALAQAAQPPHPAARVLPFAGAVRRFLGGARSLLGLGGSRHAASEEPQASSVQARDLLKVDALKAKGMEGENAVVAVIDTGLDLTHPDFKDRVLLYVDLVQAGRDAISHGTHVAGLALGDGAGSGGRYQGMAPKAKLVVLQVFDASGGGASELAILAAMKIASSLPKSIRPDVVNMSLGIAPPFGSNLHSTSLYADWLMSHGGLFMSVAAGNSGPKRGTVGAPGNARSVMTVTGVNKEGLLSFFPSRGPIVNWPWSDYNKPDIATVAGDVNREGACKYAPGGLIAARSADEDFPAGGGEACKAPDNPLYRWMTGTSMAAPELAGIAAAAIGRLKSRQVPYTMAEVKALIIETARDLGLEDWEQGAGLVDGEALAEALERRAAAGAPVGNVPRMLARQLPDFDAWLLEGSGRLSRTELGLVDETSGRLVNTQAELDALRAEAAREWSRRGPLGRAAAGAAYLLGTRNLRSKP
ncbi:MAG: S8 family serine peptidase, partial [Elusimicrobia bacterium]|nr:S8 family serine peptidase [Elusimicrobiota bacterium]